jgi:hypothetical protein
MAEPLRGSGSLAFSLRPEWANLTTTVKNYALPSLFKPSSVTHRTLKHAWSRALVILHMPSKGSWVFEPSVIGHPLDFPIGSGQARV